MRAKGIYNEGGYVLVGALLILLLLIVIGIAATTSTVMEIQIAGSDRTHKETFYGADGGTQVGSELVEQAIWNFPGTPLPVAPNPLGAALFVSPGSANLFMNPDRDSDGTLTPADPTDDVTLANRDAYFNYGTLDLTGTTIPRTDIWVGGHPQQNVGGALQQLAGYEGKGKGSAGGGGSRLYRIHSKSFGNNNSESWLEVEWLHVL
jgi:Tfp pilus assembly protein PilX